jgi:polar amino acid transport system substrate-binding protein
MVSAPHLRRRVLPMLACALTGLIVAACSSPPRPSAAGSVPPPTSAAELASKVPAEIRQQGTLIVGTDATYAPNEFRDGDGKIIGFDVELVDAIAARLGLTMRWQNSGFGDIIPGVRSGRFHLGVSSFTITSERARQVTMVPYFVAGTQWAARSGNRIGPERACGMRVAVQADTVQIADLAAESVACSHAGRAVIQVHQFEAQSDATEAVASGRVDAMIADSPVCAYAVKQSDGRLVLSSPVYNSAYYGIVLPKNQSGFGRLIGDTIDLLIFDGTYARIATKWGLDPHAYRAPSVNLTL